MSLFSSSRASSGHRAFLDALNVVLHDIRTPLGVILNVTHLMTRRIQNRDLPLDRDALLDHLTLLSTTTRGIARMINSIMQVCDARAGRGAAEPQWIQDLGKVLHDVTDAFQPQASQALVLLVLRLDEPLPPVHWDIHQIHYHVLNNLVANAIEAATPGGIVEITARLLGSGIEIRVADDGPGIPQNDRGRVFHPYVRLAAEHAPGETSHKQGLGLYSAELFTQLHGGSLSVEDGLDSHGAALVLRLGLDPFSGQSAGDDYRPVASQGPSTVKPKH